MSELYYAGALLRVERGIQLGFEVSVNLEIAFSDLIYFSQRLVEL